MKNNKTSDKLTIVEAVLLLFILVCYIGSLYFIIANNRMFLILFFVLHSCLSIVFMLIFHDKMSALILNQKSNNTPQFEEEKQMIAKYTDCQIIGLDISKDALNTALDNASKLNLFNKAIFRKSDIFSNVKPGETFDIIISNPPYIPFAQKENIQKEVSFEPETALYTNDDKGLEFYQKIIQDAPNILNKNGYILFELGINQAPYVKQILLDNKFKDIEIINDLAGIERVILGKI